MDYGTPHCPVCGNECGGEFTEEMRDFPNYSSHGCDDCACLTCKHLLDCSEVFLEEPIGFSYDADGYKLQGCLDSDIFVFESPFYTYAQFCSPCVPGAGSLNTPLTEQDGGPKVYALGLDWFDEYNPCPYADNLYSVATGEKVGPNEPL